MQRRHHPSESATTSTTNGGASVSGLTIPKGGDAAAAAPSQRARRKKRLYRSSGFSAHYGGRYSDNPLVLLGACCLGLLVGVLLVLLSLKGFTGSGSSKSSFPPNAYRPPESMEEIGDKSLEYLKLREAYDDEHPDDPIRTRAFVQSLHKRSYQTHEIPKEDAKETYDIYNCPDQPPKGYPYQWNILKLLNDWPTDDTTPRSTIYNGLCVFDYMLDLDKAKKYQEWELPFVVRGDPRVYKTVERWNTPGYMEKLLGDVPHRTEYSPNNHFMYWMRPGHYNHKNKDQPEKAHFNQIEAPSNWTQPTEMMRMPYKEWLDHANVSDAEVSKDKPHWYFRLIGCGDLNHGDCDKGSSEYLFDELPFFQPKEGLYLVETERQKGIHCRFGMKGVIAENHFDGSRNSIVLLGGERRYILAHPNQCENLALYPKGHPSARHSAVDWSEPNLEEFPQFESARANEVVMQAGDVLYLPTNWFHYIVSLELNYQCNTRSGISKDYMPEIHDCGF